MYNAILKKSFQLIDEEFKEFTKNNNKFNVLNYAVYLLDKKTFIFLTKGYSHAGMSTYENKQLITNALIRGLTGVSYQAVNNIDICFGQHLLFLKNYCLYSDCIRKNNTKDLTKLKK